MYEFSRVYGEESARTFTLKCPIYLAYIAQAWLALKRGGPILNEPKDLVLDVMVQHGDLKNRNEVVHELARGNLGQEGVTAILYANVGKLKGRISELAQATAAYARTLSARSWTLGFLWPSLRLRARMASLGWTDFDRI